VEQDAEPADELRTVARLTFRDPINAPTLRDKLRLAYNAVHPVAAGGSSTENTSAVDGDDLVDVPGLLVDTDEAFNADQTSGAMSNQWYVRMVGTVGDTQTVLRQMQQDLDSTPVLPSSSKVGGQVAGDTRSLAIAALLASLIGIVAYIWVRFQHLIFGLAAVVALVHDVLITLGAIALSAYVANLLGFLLIEEFKINLTIVAALLTIIGYSLNDTIVVFDRIREVRKLRGGRLDEQIANESINQTLSRTVLTGMTTLLCIVSLMVFGGGAIFDFALALLIGIIVGTYASIFIATPVMLAVRPKAEPVAAGK
jgi:SecD/SecF fusion protein